MAEVFTDPQQAMGEALDRKAAGLEPECCTPNLAGRERKRLDMTIVFTALGGVTLLSAVAARAVFDTPHQADLLAMIAAILLGWPIVYGAVKSLVTGKCSHDHGHDASCEHGHHHEHAHQTGSHMEELVALAVLASFVSGQYLEAGAVAFFMLIASAIEHRTATGALESIESLLRITPTRARLMEDGGEREVPAQDLKPGNKVLVLPGDKIPADGRVLNGASTVNQANITGESLPVEKRQDDEVFGGTINETGRLEVEVTRAGEDSTLGKVQSLILQAAQSKPAVVRELEKYASYYTPVVVMLAFIVWLFTGDLQHSIALLLIACPCAIILCGPTAVVASLSAAARLGVLVKSVAEMEVVRRVTSIVFDKTGTLTTGDLSVSRMRPAEGVEPAELLRLAASLEQNSRHPAAKAVVAVAQKARIQPVSAEDFQEVAGRGVRGRVNDADVLVGRPSWLEEQGVDLSPIDTTEAEGMSLLGVAKDGRAIGWLGLSDSVRKGAAGAMHELADLDVRSRVMITGDRWSPARRVAGELDLTDVQAEALPGDKLQLVRALKQAGHTVLVVGDGVNDGPALAAGDVSIAMGAAGSDVAVNAASVALMNNNLDRIPFLIKLSRETVKVIRQNVVGVAVYIILMLALLGMGFMTPLFAAIMHGVSSIAVIFNSARLVRMGEDLEEIEMQPATHDTGRVRLERVQTA